MVTNGMVTQSRSLPLMHVAPTNDRIYVLPQVVSDGSTVRTSTVSIGGPLVQATTSYRGSRSETPDDLTDPLWLWSQTSRKFWSPYDNGHAFKTEKEVVSTNLNPRKGMSKTGVYKYNALFANDFSTFLASGKSSKPYATSYHAPSIDIGVGTQFLNSTRPTKSAANIAQALIETFLDLPKLPLWELSQAKRYTDTLRKGGSEYLNAVFGWAPLVSDITKVVYAIAQSTDIIRQYERDSGKQVRRRASRPWSVQTSSVISQSPSVYTSFGTSDYYGSRIFASPGFSYGGSTVTESYTERYSFSGAFQYLLAGDETFLSKMDRYGQLANRLLGARLNIEVLWEIAPWSWLLDWFGDFGSFIAVNNSIADDNLVIRYGYLMRQVTYHRTFAHTGIGFNNGYKTGPFSSSYIYTSKERVRATPFGFGLNPDQFTDGQWAILGALGLTKAPHKLW